MGSFLLLQKYPACVVCLTWFVRREISGRTAAALWDAASRICLNIT